METALIYKDHAKLDVLLTSFWGWAPEAWGTLSFSSEARRDNLSKKLTDPFIGVIYVTSNKSFIDDAAKGKVAGFYVLSHEKGLRNQFSDAIRHNRDIGRWQYGFKAIEAYTFLPELRLDIHELIPDIKDHARHISTFGRVITGESIVEKVFSIPCKRVDVYDDPLDSSFESRKQGSSKGYVQGGAYSKEGYRVSEGNEYLSRELYVLKLLGNVDNFIGKPCKGSNIYKIGMSASPEARRQNFQKALPEGAYKWEIYKSNSNASLPHFEDFHSAIVGENAMKVFLSENADWLGGEFYLASDAIINQAWNIGVSAAR